MPPFNHLLDLSTAVQSLPPDPQKDAFRVENHQLDPYGPQWDDDTVKEVVDLLGSMQE